MPTIIIQRASEWSNWVHDYKIYVDGQKITAISNGETKELTVSPGRHTIYARIMWCSSPRRIVDLAEDDTVTFKVGGFKEGKWLLPIIVGILALNILLPAKYRQYLLALVIPAFLILLYYITLGHQKYLSLEKI